MRGTQKAQDQLLLHAKPLPKQTIPPYEAGFTGPHTLGGRPNYHIGEFKWLVKFQI